MSIYNEPIKVTVAPVYTVEPYDYYSTTTPTVEPYDSYYSTTTTTITIPPVHFAFQFDNGYGQLSTRQDLVAYAGHETIVITLPPHCGLLVGHIWTHMDEVVLKNGYTEDFGEDCYDVYPDKLDAGAFGIDIDTNKLDLHECGYYIDMIFTANTQQPLVHFEIPGPRVITTTPELVTTTTPELVTTTTPELVTTTTPEPITTTTSHPIATTTQELFTTTTPELVTTTTSELITTTSTEELWHPTMPDYTPTPDDTYTPTPAYDPVDDPITTLEYNVKVTIPEDKRTLFVTFIDFITELYKDVKIKLT